MCRLLGICYGGEPEDIPTYEIMALMFIDSVAQGPHAYGWMQYVPDKGVTVEKHRGRADTDQAIDNVITGVETNPRWVVGHTRWATHGSPQNMLNNHPIVHQNIVGVHNGVISNHEEILAKTGRFDPKTEVDSEAIFAAVNRWGPTGGLSKVYGSMVTIYTRLTNPAVLHIARTYGRQITLGWTKRGNLLFASNPRALENLQPEIEFESVSVVSENRLLVVKEGRILNRYRFRPKVRTSKIPAWDFEYESRGYPVMTPSEVLERQLIMGDRTPVSKAEPKPKPRSKSKKDSETPKDVSLTMGAYYGQRAAKAARNGELGSGIRIRDRRSSAQQNGNSSGDMMWIGDMLVTREEYEDFIASLEGDTLG